MTIYPYETTVANLGNEKITSYTQPGYSKNHLFKEKNYYFLNKKDQVEGFKKIFQGNFTIIDTETTGRNLFGQDLPFQVSILKIKNWKIYKKTDYLINVDKEIPKEVLDLTGLKIEDIRNSKLGLKEAIEDIIKNLNSEEFIFAHNANFDIAILNNALVHTNTFLKKDINIMDSIHIYYVLLKHLLGVPVSGSSLDLLGNTFLKKSIDINDERRHQADFDCEVVFLLLQKLKIFFENDINKGNNSIILNKLEKETELNDFLNNKMPFKYNDKSVVERLHHLGDELSKEYEMYLYKYLGRLKQITDSIINYLTTNHKNDINIIKTLGNEIFFDIHLDNYYFKKQAIYDFVKPEYQKSYIAKKTRIYTENNFLIDFFNNKYDERREPFVIKDLESLKKYVEEYKTLSIEALALETEIKNKVKIINAHQKHTTSYSKYGNVRLEYTQEPVYLIRTMNVAKLEEDFKKGIIKSLDDTIDDKESYLNLTIYIEE